MGQWHSNTERCNSDFNGTSASAANVWADNDFNAASLHGKSSNNSEGNAKAFNIYLAQAAKAGDTITLALAGDVASQFKTNINGAVITLAKGQVSVSLSLDQQGDITADKIGNISASYAGTGQNSQTAQSNTWALTLKDAGEVDNTSNDDFLVKKDKHTGSLLCSHAVHCYKFRILTRTYPMGKSSIRYRKMACHARNMCPCALQTSSRRGSKNTIDSIAACAHKQGARGIFDSKNQLRSRQNQLCLPGEAYA